jgi:hypothetical protein
LKQNYNTKAEKDLGLKGARIAQRTLAGRQVADIYLYNPVPDKNMNFMESADKLNRDISVSAPTTPASSVAAPLNSEQVAANFLMQFISSCHKEEDNFASKYALDMDNLFMFMNLMRVDLD